MDFFSGTSSNISESSCVTLECSTIRRQYSEWSEDSYLALLSVQAKTYQLRVNNAWKGKPMLVHLEFNLQ